MYAASADIGVSIASTDATPASMIESMASRLSMVMGDAVTIDEWITPGEGGEVVQCRDEDAVTEALLKLLRDPDLRAQYGERNEQVVRERLGDPGEQLETLYSRLV
jgi:glycosyltransferase involved in cell wall biosynthesis